MFTNPLRLATEEIERYRRSVHERALMPPADLSPLRNQVAGIDFLDPLSDENLIEMVGNLLSQYAVQTPHPQYFGLFNPDVTSMSVAADAMVAGFNCQLAAYSHNPAANEIERHTLALFLNLAGIPQGVGAFTSGGSEANQSAVIAALTHQSPEFAARGAKGQPTLYVSVEAHHSFVKIAHGCGIGREAVRIVPVDLDLRMNISALAAMVAQDRSEGKTPFMVVATAGTTAGGAIDPLPECASFCAKENLWFHVDAAWGGAALLSVRLRPLLAGVEHAASITIDAHKWLSVPMGAGMFLCSKPETVRQAFGISTAYMPAPLDAPDPYLTSIQWSRRFIGLKLFMSLANQGLEGYARQVEHHSEMGALLTSKLRENGWEVVKDSPFAVLTFRHPKVSPKELVAEVHRRMRVWVSETHLSHYGSVIRACITNYRTQPADVEALLQELELCARTCESA
jgi:glutamate/tyrosine decarboxylase-like PLP-dependent enzyme